MDEVEGVITFDDGKTTSTSYGPMTKNVTLCKTDDGNKYIIQGCAKSIIAGLEKVSVSAIPMLGMRIFENS